MEAVSAVDPAFRPLSNLRYRIYRLAKRPPQRSFFAAARQATEIILHKIAQVVSQLQISGSPRPLDYSSGSADFFTGPPSAHYWKSKAWLASARSGGLSEVRPARPRSKSPEPSISRAHCADD